MRLRLTFTKTGGLRYIGHLDLQTVWERTVRRAGLPLAYTQGFHPGPKIQIAAALPLGFIGRAEIVDLWLDEPEAAKEPLDDMKARLQQAAPPGLIITRAEAVDERGPALQTRVSSAVYEATLLEASDPAGLQASVTRLLEAESLPRQRREKDYDLRPLIESLECGGQPLRLQMVLASRPGATGRPEEVLDCLGIPVENARIERTRLILQEDVK
jgi:radical SAM-linked protein